MKRIFSALLAASLVVCLFAACSGGSANYNVSDVAKAVGDVCKIDNPKEFDDDAVVWEIGLSEEDFEEYAGQRTLTNGQPGTVLVVKAKAGKADTVKAALEKYRDDVLAVSANYKSDFPVGYEQTKNARVVAKGDYVVYAVAGEGVDYADVDTAIDEALK